MSALCSHLGAIFTTSDIIDVTPHPSAVAVNLALGRLCSHLLFCISKAPFTLGLCPHFTQEKKMDGRTFSEPHRLS